MCRASTGTEQKPHCHKKPVPQCDKGEDRYGKIRKGRCGFCLGQRWASDTAQFMGVNNC